jgi:hypothetical protein
MLKNTNSEMEAVLDACINLGNFYTFDNDWTFYGFKKIGDDVDFIVSENEFQSHILNYIAILAEVKLFVEAVESK